MEQSQQPVRECTVKDGGISISAAGDAVVTHHGDVRMVPFLTFFPPPQGNKSGDIEIDSLEVGYV